MKRSGLKFGEFTEYSITAAGFDVVENKLDDREAARSRAWLFPRTPRATSSIIPTGRMALTRHGTGSRAAPPCRKTGTSITSRRTSTPSRQPEANAEVARGPVQLEEAFRYCGAGYQVAGSADSAAAESTEYSGHASTRIPRTNSPPPRSGIRRMPESVRRTSFSIYCGFRSRGRVGTGLERRTSKRRVQENRAAGLNP